MNTTGAACPLGSNYHTSSPIVTSGLSHVQVHRSIVSVINQFYGPDESGDNHDTTAGYHAITSGPRTCRSSGDVYAWIVASQVVVVVVVFAREGDGLGTHWGTANAVHFLSSLRVEKVCSWER